MAIENKIINDILTYVGNQKKSDWYVGIATDIEERLFSNHNVAKNGSAGWIFRTAVSEQNADNGKSNLQQPFFHIFHSLHRNYNR